MGRMREKQEREEVNEEIEEMVQVEESRKRG
jgi:hypothetical protein